MAAEKDRPTDLQPAAQVIQSADFSEAGGIFLKGEDAVFVEQGIFFPRHGGEIAAGQGAIVVNRPLGQATGLAGREANQVSDQRIKDPGLQFWRPAVIPGPVSGDLADQPLEGGTVRRGKISRPWGT